METKPSVSSLIKITRGFRLRRRSTRILVLQSPRLLDVEKIEQLRGRGGDEGRPAHQGLGHLEVGIEPPVGLDVAEGGEVEVGGNGRYVGREVALAAEDITVVGEAHTLLTLAEKVLVRF